VLDDLSVGAASNQPHAKTADDRWTGAFFVAEDGVGLDA
jgi:hypothetical protein